MFDIGFFELLLIAVVGLIVIGPKRLPETIRFVGLWIGRLRRSLSAAKKEFEQEFGIDDVRRQLHNEAVMQELEESKKVLMKEVEDAKGTLTHLEKMSTEKVGNLSPNTSIDSDHAEQPIQPSDEKPNV